MDAQDLVLDRYPHAEATEEPPVFRHGDFAPIDRGYWIIVADADSTALGDGITEEAAWEDAARKLGRPRVGHRTHPGHSRLARMLHLLV